MNLNHVETFLILAETLSFNETARRLKISQPAVSKQVQGFESDVGVSLFVRFKKTVTLTAEGMELRQKLKRSYPAFLHDLNLSRQRQKLVIAGLPEFMEYAIQPHMGEFLRSNPEVEVEIKCASNVEVRLLVESGVASIGFGIIPRGIENIKAYKILSQQCHLVAAKKLNPGDLKNVTELPFVGYQIADPLIRLYLQKNYPKQSLSDLRLAYIINSHRAIVDFLLANPGHLAVLPELSAPVQEAFRSKKLTLIPGGSLQADIFMFLLDQPYLSSPVQKFMKFCRDKLHE